MKKHVRTHAVVSIALATLICGFPGAARPNAGQGNQGNQGSQDGGGPDGSHRIQTATPIKHVIVIIGENRTFDNVYGTYVPRHGQHVANLLSRGIVRADGSPGPNSAAATQFRLTTINPVRYFIDTDTLITP